MPREFPRARATGRTRLPRTIVLAALYAAIAVPPVAAQDRLGRQDEPRPSRQIEVRGGPPPAGGGPPATASIAYRGALSRLAAGMPAEAAAALAAFEQQADTNPAGGPSRATERSVVEVLDGIARRDPEALLPAMLLHVERFRTHREAGDLLLVDHHAAMLGRAAVLYAERAGSPEARGGAAEVLAAIGSALLEDQRFTLARRTLDQALAIDAENPAALLALAVDRERHGLYPEAVGFLERLVAVRPESSEARLRLGINLGRIGRRHDAAESLAALTRDHAAEPWAVQNAYRELAKMRLADNDAGGAARLLREGLGRFPDSERLRLQLAYALDRGGDPSAARRLVADLAKQPPADVADEPRRRYNRFPDATPLLALTEVRKGAGERLGALAAVLVGLAEDEL